MKAIAIASAILVLTAGVASADQGHKYRHHGHAAKHSSTGHLTLFERIKIARSKAKLNSMKHRIVADGRVTRREKIRLANATQRHRAMVRKERRD